MNDQAGPVLIVEDVPDTLNLVELTLTFKGYQVTTATNGQEALQAIEAERPALIITDILMPKMDGFSLVHRLRINPETRTIPVIFLSATYISPEDKAFAIAIGITKFIEKPIHMEALLQDVEETLASHADDIHEPLDEKKFYEGYYRRLESKLQQKGSQITRIEGMMESLPENEKESFEISLQHVIREREEIQHLIDEIRGKLDRKEGLDPSA